MRTLLAFVLLATSAFALELWYDEPADRWTEALPIGNGQLGAMVFGGAVDERIQLNEESLWSGGPQEADNPEALEYLPKVRELLEAGEYEKAERLTIRKLVCKGEGSGRGNGTDVAYGSFQTLGDLWLTHPGVEEEDVVYTRRDLILSTGTAQTHYAVDGQPFTRTVFLSTDPSVLVVVLATVPGKTIDLDIALDRHPANCATPWKNDGLRERKGTDPEKALAIGRAEGDNQLTMAGQLWDGKGMRHHTAVRALPQEGSVTAEGNELHVRGATSITLLLAAATDYAHDSPESLVRARLDEAVASPDQLTVRHAEPLLRLGAQTATPTDGRLRALDEEDGDPAFAALYFEFGRHLLRGSSGPSGILPANLQGIWCDHIQAPWNADYHNNINDQMNYWPAEVTGMGEEHEVFLRFIESLVEPGSKTARVHYGAHGWVTHTISNVWGYTSPGEHPTWGAFVGASGWLCQHLWEHYAFNPDLEYLKRAYPTMKSAAQFYLAFLVEEPQHGWLVTSPSNSPENRFRTAAGEEAQICMGPTMDMQIVRELFTNCITAGELLEDDPDFVQQLKDARARLAPMQIGKHGQLQEWLHDFDEVEPGHRHVSHLYGLHPGNQISPDTTPELAEAARVTLERRLANGGGHTGWSRAWIVNFYARLLDGEKAHYHLMKLFQDATFPNLFGNHPPFQIDANFGATAGIAEMLLQSHDGYVHLLPALPSAWPEGNYRRFQARGGCRVDVSWTRGKLDAATIYGKSDQEIPVRYGNVTRTFQLDHSGQVTVSAEDFIGELAGRS